MANVPRIGAKEAYGKMEEGALLVCAYEEEEKCKKINLEGSLNLREFEQRAGNLGKDRELIFYCA
ncbi:MAG: ArsR family transcriptional regulator [Candidatus Tectomicrobia bacterium]|uniref:ArsR family transcriptional regulator n=1 Tax=Tectimicrobiota bacterium TaxID=2528274 RepID=A0A932HZI9_UNCTE|nr:ArsR family transcriptional regulator [Candidatus Tectomicrobia bacterium]